MRRCLHAFLVGMLTLSTTMDAARACWYLRRGCHGTRHAVVCLPPMATEPVCQTDAAMIDGWSTVGTVAACDTCGECAVTDSVVGDVIVAEDIVTSDHPAMAVVAEIQSPTVAEAVVAPQPTPAEPPTTSVVEVVPELQPAEPAPRDDVRQTAAIGDAALPADAPGPAEVIAEPVAEPAPASEAAAPMPAAVVLPTPEPVEENIFEEVDRAAERSTDTALAAERPAEATDERGFAEEPAFADEPLVPADDPVPGTGEPATEPVPAVEGDATPLPSSDAASRGLLEPARRWIDRTGGYAVVGALVAVRSDGTCVIESQGRTIEVPLEALSEFDRDYATTAAERLAQASGPDAGDTVGL